MAYNFVMADRDQRFLLPPDMREWLPEDHLVWWLIDVVDELDLSAFRTVYRDDGHGRAAYDPALMVAVLLYAYCHGICSSRVIERRCVEDIAFRVLAGGHTPDHTTLARFRQRHQEALAGLLAESLRLCQAAGLVRVGTVVLDGTRLRANASRRANRTEADIDAEVARMMAEAEEADAADDEGEPAPERFDRTGRRARVAEAKQQLRDDAVDRAARFEARQAAEDAKAAAAGRPARRLRPRRHDEAPRPDAKANLTDPDSREMRAVGGPIQGYNAQAGCTPDGVIVGAELTHAGNDVEQLDPMLETIDQTLRRAGLKRRRPRRVVADRGYWRAENIRGDDRPFTVELFIPPRPTGNTGKPRKDGAASQSKTEHLRQAMRARLDTPRGRNLLRTRATVIEPIFGDIKENRRFRRFSRRGLAACASEWKLICATHNLLKLHRHHAT